MFKLAALLLLYVAAVFANCDIESSITERLDSAWQQPDGFYQIYDINITNTGSCLYEHIYVTLAFDDNSSISNTWNYDSETREVKNFGHLIPGASFAQVGIILMNTNEVPAAPAVASTTAECKSSCPTDASSNDASSNDASSNDASSNDASSNDASSNDASSNDASSNDASSNDASSNDASSDDASSDDASSDDASSNDASSNDASSNDASSNDASSNDASSNDASSNDASSNDASSNDASSNDASSNDASSSDVPTDSSDAPTSAPTGSPSNDTVDTNCKLSVSQTRRVGGSWVTDGYAFQIYELTFTNFGSKPVVSAQVDLSLTKGYPSAYWEMTKVCCTQIRSVVSFDIKINYPLSVGSAITTGYVLQYNASETLVDPYYPASLIQTIFFNFVTCQQS